MHPISILVADLAPISVLSAPLAEPVPTPAGDVAPDESGVTNTGTPPTQHCSFKTPGPFASFGGVKCGQNTPYVGESAI